MAGRTQDQAVYLSGFDHFQRFLCLGPILIYYSTDYSCVEEFYFNHKLIYIHILIYIFLICVIVCINTTHNVSL